MPKCKCCGEPVVNGVVLHSECYDRLAKDTNVPDKRVGEWEEQNKYPGYLRCSVCRDCYIPPNYLVTGKWSYCPNCGARMKGAKDGSTD